MSSQSSSSAIGVALVDSDPMALAYLRSCLSADADIQVLTATHSPDQLMAFLQAHGVDVLITSLHGGARDPADESLMIKEVLRASPRTRVVVLATQDSEDSLMQSLEAGASGVLLKSSPPEEILSAVRAVHSGGKVVTPVLTPRLIDHALASLPDVDDSVALSCREKDVLRLLCEGASNREIASRLAISEATVKTHVSVLLGKTGARSRLEIAVWAFRHGHAQTGPRSSS
ncbi:LuxR C-terminal-related transcriptional regulator [Actinomyces wuliandei]|uniref:LuxR C-terminal-related transcriptional regulator n=1 Tax=Actinomyces wuliandei TaxID=2057743 RepID=UPI000FD7BB0D|nr:response regulator transcription factor [Actinomyces wuliandei]